MMVMILLLKGDRLLIITITSYTLKSTGKGKSPSKVRALSGCWWGTKSDTKERKTGKTPSGLQWRSSFYFPKQGESLFKQTLGRVFRFLAHGRFSGCVQNGCYIEEEKANEYFKGVGKSPSGFRKVLLSKRTLENPSNF